jgi:hypothetical protein
MGKEKMEFGYTPAFQRNTQSTDSFLNLKQFSFVCPIATSKASNINICFNLLKDKIMKIFKV